MPSARSRASGPTSGSGATSARLLLAGAVGALLTASVVTLGAGPEPATGVVTTAVVTATASCAGGGQDQVSVRRPGVSTTAAAALDACGQPAGSTVSVQVAADGTVGPVVTLAGTRAPDRGSRLPVLVLAVLVALTGAVAAAGLRAPRARLGSKA